ncbi:MAG: lipopolysaccharide biosynthesis protein, partial [Psychromonas sp.]
MVLARLLEPSDFGLIAMLMVIVGIAEVFSDVGLGGALIQRSSVSPLHYSSVFYFNLFIASLLALITFFSAEVIADFYSNQLLTPLTQTISVLFIIKALSSVQAIRLKKQLNYGLLSKAGFVSSLLSGVVGISLAYSGLGVWALMVQIISQGVFFNIIIWRYAAWKPELIFSLQALRQLWGFGFRMFLSGLIDAIYRRLDFLIIGKIFSAATLGYYHRARQFNELVINYSSGSLMSVMFPILSKVQHDLPRFKNIVFKGFYILCFVTFLLLGGLYLNAEDLIVFLFSEKWLPSVGYLEILVLSGFGYPLSALLVNVLSSRGNSKAFLKLEIMKKSIASINLLNAVYFGIEVYLYGLIVTAALSVLLNVWFASKEIEVSMGRFIKPILLQMILAITSVLFTLEVISLIDVNVVLEFLIKSTIFCVLFTALNYVLKTKSYSEIYALIKERVGKCKSVEA